MPDLPIELIELCFSFVDSSDKSSWAAICTTSKLGQQITTPKLYNSIGWTEDGPIGQELCNRLGILCRSLRDPSLTKHVKSLLYAFGPDVEPGREVPSPGFGSGRLLSRAPSTNRVHIPEHYAVWLDAQLDRISSGVESDLEDCVERPALTTVYALLVITRAPNLECLELRCDMTEVITIQVLLNRCPNLRRLTIEKSIRRDRHPNWSRLSAALRSTRPRLRYLSIMDPEYFVYNVRTVDLDKGRPSFASARYDHHGLGRLHKLSSLQFLTVTEYALFGCLSARCLRECANRSTAVCEPGMSDLGVKALDTDLPPTVETLTIISDALHVNRWQVDNLFSDPRAAGLSELTLVDFEGKRWGNLYSLGVQLLT
jgi:hypothetical protein